LKIFTYNCAEVFGVNIVGLSKESARLKSAITILIKEINKLCSEIRAGNSDDNVLKQVSELIQRKEKLMERVRKARIG